MSLRPLEISQIVRELTRNLSGAFVQKAWVPDTSNCLLEFRLPGQSWLVGLVFDSPSARIELCSQRGPSPKVALPSQGKLRSTLVGARLKSLEQVADRRVQWFFDKKGQALTLLVDLSSKGFVALVEEAERKCTFLPPDRRQSLEEATRRNVSSELVEGEPSRLSDKGHPVFPYAFSAHQLWSKVDVERDVQQWRKEQMAPLKARLRRLVRTLEKVKEESERSEEAHAHRRLGALLMQNLPALRRGDLSVRLTEYTERGPVEAEVTLNPEKTPREQAEWHLHQYRRLLRGSEHAQRRLGELSREREAIEARLKALASAVPGAPAPNESRRLPTKKGPSLRKPFREYVGSGGQIIRVGKNAAGNDALTFQFSAPQDVWFHVRGQPGSHVVVPLDKTKPLLPEILLDAATLAVHHSDAKKEPRAEVSYTQIKYLRKARGGAPGQVAFTHEKSLLVRMEPDRLRRLLENLKE